MNQRGATACAREHAATASVMTSADDDVAQARIVAESGSLLSGVVDAERGGTQHPVLIIEQRELVAADLMHRFWGQIRRRRSVQQPVIVVAAAIEMADSGLFVRPGSGECRIVQVVTQANQSRAYELVDTVHDVGAPSLDLALGHFNGGRLAHERIVRSGPS